MNPPASALAFLFSLETAAGRDTMPLKPRIKVKARGIPIAGVIVKTDANGKQIITKKDTAPPHVRAGRRRKAGKITGARAAK